MEISPFAGKRADPSLLINVPRLITAYYTGRPNPSIYDLAAKLQDEGVKAFVSCWNDLMNVTASRSSKLAKAS